jgi:hypothetical protein
MQRVWWIWLLGPAAATTALLVAFAVFAGEDGDPSRPAAVTPTETTAPPPPPPRRTTTRRTTTRTTATSATTRTAATTTTTTTTPPPPTTTTSRRTTTTRQAAPPPPPAPTAPRRIVRVPDLYGLTEHQALTLLRRRGLRGKLRRERSFQPEGLVFTQRPARGAQSRQGTTVSFTVAFYPPRTEPPPPPAPPVSNLPPVVGLDYWEAAARMEVQGMLVDTYPVRAGRRAAYVVRQSPAAGTRVSRGSRVKLTVSIGNGRQLTPRDVPNLVGLRELRAHAVCRDARFTCRTFVVPEGPPGRVVRQRPEAGEQLRSLSQIRLLVGAE